MKTKSTSGWVLAATSVASLMVALDTLVVSTALTTIRHDLGGIDRGGSSGPSSRTTSASPCCSCRPPRSGNASAASACSRSGLGLFAATSAACALAPGVGWLISARAVQGAGAALEISLALAIVSAAYPPERRGAAIGILEGITGLAVVAGPVIWNLFDFTRDGRDAGWQEQLSYR